VATFLRTHIRGVKTLFLAMLLVPVLAFIGNVAREGAGNIAKGYYVFGADACQEMKQGKTEKFMLDQYAMFFGPWAAPIVAAALKANPR